MATDYGGRVSNRKFARRLLDDVRAIVAAGAVGSLATSITAMPSAASVVATDRFPLVTSAGIGYKASASLLRAYILGISGGTATIPENLTVTQVLTVNGNTSLGNASGDTLTVAPNAVTWTNNPTHSGNHTFSGTLTGTDLWTSYPSGTTNPRTNWPSPFTAARILASASSGDALSFIRGDNGDTAGATLVLARTGNTDPGVLAVVAQFDTLGSINFRGAVSASATGSGATIIANVEGAAPSATSLPTALHFATTAVGALSPTRRLTLSEAGHLHPSTFVDPTNTYDLGLTGARWRTGYFGTSVIAPVGTFATSVGTPAVTSTGALTLTATAATLSLVATGDNAITGTVNATEAFRVENIANATSTEYALLNPVGTIMARLPLTTDVSLFSASDSIRIHQQMTILRAGNQAIWIGARANTSLTAPSGVLTAQTVLNIEGRGYSSGTSGLLSMASMRFVTTENVTDAAHGGDILFLTTPVGSTTLTNILRLSATDEVRVYGADLIWDTDNTKSIGLVGANRPQYVRAGSAVHVGTPTSEVTSEGFVTGGTIGIASIYSASSDNPASVVLRRGNTSIASPTAILSGEALGQLIIGGYDGTSWAGTGTPSSALLFARATQNWSDTQRGTEWAIATTANGAVSATTRWLWTQAGYYTPATTATYDIGSSSLAVRELFVRTLDTDGANDMVLQRNNVTKLTLQGGLATFTTPIATSAPTGGAGNWELGIANAVSPTAPDRTITVEIGGTAYYIHCKTTND